jgi:hypothetical protein
LIHCSIGSFDNLLHGFSFAPFCRTNRSIYLNNQSVIARFAMNRVLTEYPTRLRFSTKADAESFASRCVDWIQTGCDPLRVHYKPVFPLLLCPIHGLIGQLDQPLLIFAVGRIRDDSNTCRDLHGYSIDEERFYKRSQEFSGDLLNLSRVVDIREQNYKFIATDPGHRMR